MLICFGGDRIPLQTQRNQRRAHDGQAGGLPGRRRRDRGEGGGQGTFDTGKGGWGEGGWVQMCDFMRGGSGRSKVKEYIGERSFGLFIDTSVGSGHWRWLEGLSCWVGWTTTISLSLPLVTAGRKGRKRNLLSFGRGVGGSTEGPEVVHSCGGGDWSRRMSGYLYCWERVWIVDRTRQTGSSMESCTYDSSCTRLGSSCSRDWDCGVVRRNSLRS